MPKIARYRLLGGWMVCPQVVSNDFVVTDFFRRFEQNSCIAIQQVFQYFDRQTKY